MNAYSYNYYTYNTVIEEPKLAVVSAGGTKNCLSNSLAVAFPACKSPAFELKHVESPKILKLAAYNFFHVFFKKNTTRALISVLILTCFRLLFRTISADYSYIRELEIM